MSPVIGRPCETEYVKKSLLYPRKFKKSSRKYIPLYKSGIYTINRMRINIPSKRLIVLGESISLIIYLMNVEIRQLIQLTNIIFYPHMAAPKRINVTIVRIAKIIASIKYVILSLPIF